MFDRKRFDNLIGRFAAIAVVLCAGAVLATACPFCSVESRTLTEEINASEAVVLAKLVAEAPPLVNNDDEDPDSGKATFEVVDVLRGDNRVKQGDTIKVVYFGEGERDKEFMISGFAIENDAIEWTTPLPLSAPAIAYIRQLPAVPAAGVERLLFFQEYLENDDPLLAQDAYDEFARAPYAELHELEGHMHHDRLVEWVQSSDVNPSRRRLYLTMLGVCGDKSDLPMLEQMIVSDYSFKKPIVEQMVASGRALQGPLALEMWTEMVDLEERQKKLGLDATIGCYLVLRGPEGLDLVDERFLKNPKVEYTHAYMTIMALRIIGEETHAVPRERLLASMRLLLGQPRVCRPGDPRSCSLGRLVRARSTHRDVQERRRKELHPPAGGDLFDRGQRAAGRHRHPCQGGPHTTRTARSRGRQKGPQPDGLRFPGPGPQHCAGNWRRAARIPSRH